MGLEARINRQGRTGGAVRNPLFGQQEGGSFVRRVGVPMDSLYPSSIPCIPESMSLLSGLPERKYTRKSFMAIECIDNRCSGYLGAISTPSSICNLVKLSSLGVLTLPAGGESAPRLKAQARSDGGNWEGHITSQPGKYPCMEGNDGEQEWGDCWRRVCSHPSEIDAFGFI